MQINDAKYEWKNKNNNHNQNKILCIEMLQRSNTNKNEMDSREHRQSFNKPTKQIYTTNIEHILFPKQKNIVFDLIFFFLGNNTEHADTERASN